MRQRGAKVVLAAPADIEGTNLPIVETGAVDLDPISLIQSFYPMVEQMARMRGRNPDEPRFLAKVTKTS
jgi:glucosamine--fructose-6-phosphate aminotransferase (isomerizing)